MKRKLLTLWAVGSLLFASVAGAKTHEVDITTASTHDLPINIIIPEGASFTVRIGSDSEGSGWTGVSIDLQVKANDEWVTISDFDNVSAAKIIQIIEAPGDTDGSGADWRFSITGDASNLKAYFSGNRL